MTRKIGVLLAIFLLVVLVTVLLQKVQPTARPGRPTMEPLTSSPDFVGWVMGVDSGSEMIQVESQADKIVCPVAAKLSKDTIIFRREGGVLRQVNISEVHLKDQAELWLSVPVPSSFPAQVTVRQMIVEKLH